MNTFWKNIKNSVDGIKKEKILDKIPSKYHSLKNGQQFDRRKLFAGYDTSIRENKNIKIWAVILFIWCFTLSFYYILFSNLSSIVYKVENKINVKTESPFSLYKPGIDILNSFSGTKYVKYIQRLYVHPKEKNKMMIMVNPNYWGTLDTEQREKLMSKVLDKWKKLYKNSEEEKLEPQVAFANSNK